MENNSFFEINSALRNAKYVLILPHINADADSLGSSVAIYRALKKENIKVKIVIEDSIASNLRFLIKDVDIINVQDSHKDLVEIDEEYLAVCVDCGDESRFPRRKEIFENASVKICIDHHLTSKGIGDLNYIDSNASATAELVYLMLKEGNFHLDEIAREGIFAGITTDTGNFQYSNTNLMSHKIANELYEMGLDFNKVSVEIYERVSIKALKLQGKVLDEIKLFADDKGAISFVSQEMLKDTGASMDDSEGFVSKLRSIDSVEVAALIREEKDGSVKGSLRAKTDVDVAVICQELGGGGHRKAAGFKIDKPLDETILIVIKKITKAIENQR